MTSESSSVRGVSRLPGVPAAPKIPGPWFVGTLSASIIATRIWPGSSALNSAQRVIVTSQEVLGFERRIPDHDLAVRPRLGLLELVGMHLAAVTHQVCVVNLRRRFAQEALAHQESTA